MKNLKLPTVLTESEVNELLAAPDLTTAPGIRDKAILEILYGCGLRVSELTNLSVYSINKKEQSCRIVGKGNRERIVPIRPIAQKWLDKYITEVRAFHPRRDSKILFPNHQGSPLSRQAIWNLVEKYSDLTLIEKKIHPHTLRHSIATHLRSRATDLDEIQNFLGHENITTTGIYVHLDISHLKNIFKTNHPR